MSTIKVMERRAFLKYTFGAGALILGTHVESWASDADKAAFHPDVFVGIQPTGEVIIVGVRKSGCPTPDWARKVLDASE